ncbi:MAG TPA: Ig-like domain-containing protein, partial [bacterium]|nr:Ig-like domain-containing protein [bacterium]
MKKFISIIFLAVIFPALILTSCDNQKAGTFAVKFSWAKDDAGKEVKPDVSTGEFFVTVRIYEWKEGVTFPGDIAANGKQLTQSEPAQMKATGTSIDFGDLSYGSRRFVVAEIRKGEELTNSVLFTGMSQLFELKAGKHTEVNVEMKLTPTPGVDEEGNRIDAELRIVDDNGNLRSYTSGNDLKVKLRLLNAVSFTHVYFANKEENLKTANGKSYKIGELKEIKDVDNGYELDGEWDLSFGLTTDEIAVLPELKVYARLENEYGTGLLVMAKIALDNQSPELTLGLNPAYTNGSKTITLNISANELIKHDSLNIQTTNDKLVFDCPAPTKNESLSFTCTIETLDATLKDGDFTITVSAADQAGNKSEETKTTLTIDRESPELTFVAYKNGTEVDDTIYLKENDEFKVDLTLSKEPAETPVVRLGSAGINCEKTADLKYSCAAEIKKETYSEGISDLSVNYLDMAENQFSGIIVSGIRLDYTAPVLNTQIVPGNKSLNASQILQITVNASEELSSAPTVTLAKNGGGAITLDNTEIQGLSYIYTYPTLVDGTYSFTADATDLAGHNAPQVSITSIISDSSVPTVSETVTVNPTRIKPSATSTITFTASETMNDTGDTVEVKVGDGTANCTTSNGLNYFCTYTGTAGTEDSIETVIIKLADSSANTSTGSHGTVYVDRTAPAITIDLNKNAFNSSDIIRVSVTSSEELVSAPAVEIPEISMSLSNVTQVSNFSWIFTVDPADLIDDDYTVTAEGVDLVSLTGSDIAYFSVDSSIPDLVTGTIDRTKAGLNITYTVDFEITEPVTGGIPVVKANDIALTNCVQNGSDKIFKCSRTVGAEETDST